VIPEEQRARVGAARVGRLATLRADGTPRLVPITFALVEGLICFAVDEVKPKSTTRLARLADIARDPRVAVLVDHYAEDWSQLWWVRVDGTAEVRHDGGLREQAMAALRVKYEQYARAALGPVVVITPTGWSGWAATGSRAAPAPARSPRTAP
jgi:PPOX class probable F420-dependent enzyme